ncbi:MAG: 1-acyl-sn-glycerol-3-phosphate acyltransferase [Actinomycetota bacterium]|nr:1-acyl-sn-glycerol-3-phosphate acyltransferase [Actinomycetota bacterium]
MTLLYDAVAAGMWAYTHAAFAVTTLGPRRFRLEPGTLLVSTHRRETDVPVVCPPLYARARLWRHRSPPERLSFAARADMFLPGFLAGFPPGLSPRVRRLLYPVAVGRRLAAMHVHPLRSARVACLGEALAAEPERPLHQLVPAALLAELTVRAGACGLTPPGQARDVLRGEYADLLWRAVSPADVPAVSDRFWAGRAAEAARDFRALVELVRSGGVLLVFPEGKPSRDGEIGPIQRGLAALVRRGEPSLLQPLALAYDPLTRGRTRVFVSIGDQVPAPRDDVEASVLALLHRTMPLTSGQVVAHHLTAGAGRAPAELDRAAGAAVEAARGEGRNVEPDLLDAKRRRARLLEALAAAPGRPGDVAYLAREYRSARETA